MNVLGALRIVLDKVEDVRVVGVEQADVVVAALFDGEVEGAFAGALLLGGVPGAEVATAEYGTEVAPERRLVQHLPPSFAHLQETKKSGGFFLYFIQQCFICRASDSTEPEDPGIEPRTVAISALDVGRSNHSAKSRKQNTKNAIKFPLSFIMPYVYTFLPTRRIKNP